MFKFLKKESRSYKMEFYMALTRTIMAVIVFCIQLLSLLVILHVL